MEGHALTGIIYGIIHPDFPGYTKVGRTIQPMHRRLKDYNVCCPRNLFTTAFTIPSTDIMAADRAVKAALKPHQGDAIGEWVQLWPQEVLDVIQSLPNVEEIGMTRADMEAWADLLRKKYGIKWPFADEDDTDYDLGEEDH